MKEIYAVISGSHFQTLKRPLTIKSKHTVHLLSAVARKKMYMVKVMIAKWKHKINKDKQQVIKGINLPSKTIWFRG